MFSIIKALQAYWISREIKLYLTYYKIPFPKVQPQTKNLL